MMVEGVAGVSSHPRQKASHFHDIGPGRHAGRHFAILADLVVGSDHATAVFLLQLGDAADMSP